MKMQKQMMGFLLFVLAVLLVACGGASAGDPAATVEQFLQAKVAGDATAIRGLLCAEMEANYEREAMTFAGVSGVELDGMSCSQVGETEVVACTGRIVAMYGTEENEFPLVSYRVVQEDGAWKWCGESY
jgi:hypothetical protein